MRAANTPSPVIVFNGISASVTSFFVVSTSKHCSFKQCDERDVDDDNDNDDDGDDDDDDDAAAAAADVDSTYHCSSHLSSPTFPPYLARDACSLGLTARCCIAT
jgi:hypothetical protein